MKKQPQPRRTPARIWVVFCPTGAYICATKGVAKERAYQWGGSFAQYQLVEPKRRNAGSGEG